ncbi:DUF6361 family protein [uncultured Brevibacterium sp.]|mgnify:CR=1 FL=1|uniref:DUF6361 family protein n=1 Tax=uncultured Brevibacterium sp. TaxID=189678 RepID=UPI0025D4A76D|nr:DUF6361 family protein [uncultured Brevibacterium sp.]
MVAAITWLDASSEDQRRMRDIIRLFEDHESRDELGLSQFRDAISDGLFPGTSTLLTRARYLLFVPWAYSLPPGRISESEVKRRELRTIEALKGTEDLSGLLGRRAGKTLKTLPSAIYWSALRQYGILGDSSVSRQQAATGRGSVSSVFAGPASAEVPIWHPGLPPVPQGFPHTISDGFALSRLEAEWLRERMAKGASGSLLTHLLYDPPEPEGDVLWLDPAVRRAAGPAADLVDHAQVFAEIIYGAQLLYNLMLAEEYEAAGYTAILERVTHYSGLLEEWAGSSALNHAMHHWDFGDLRRTVETIRGSQVHPRTASFVEKWYATIADYGPHEIGSNAHARSIIARREKQMKPTLMRLGRPERLRHWTGGSGAGKLGFRWFQARRILSDIHDGLARTLEAANA